MKGGDNMKKAAIAIMTVLTLAVAVTGIVTNAPTTQMADPEDRP